MPNHVENQTLHLRDASDRTAAFLTEQMTAHPELIKMSVIEDVTGRISIAVWGVLTAETRVLFQGTIGQAHIAGLFWSGRILIIDPDDEESVKLGDDLLRFAQPVPDSGQRVWVAHRYLSRGGWIATADQDPWPREKPDTPPVVVFYSFKGGVGRSTVLATTALALAHQGKRVVVVDGDLDAPGIAGAFLASDQEPPPRGLVDYLIDALTIDAPKLDDYLFSCTRQALTGNGSIRVLAAGLLDAQYPLRLSHLSFGPETNSATLRLQRLLERIRDEERPDVILFDARTGFTDLAVTALGGFGHLHVLIGTASGQTWAGMQRVVEWLGQRRLQAGKPQSDCVLALTMQPRSSDLATPLCERFTAEAYLAFRDCYYAEREWAETNHLAESVCLLEDWPEDAPDAPHKPVSIDYDEKFVAYCDVASIAEALMADPGNAALVGRIAAFCWPEGGTIG
jgi:hypothetical protein